MLVNGEDTNKFAREKFLKKLEELSLKSTGEIPQLDELTDEQKEWVNRKIKDSESSWGSYW